jgi:DnaJ-class molecular chaperone with C-terminal Zn finger domain
MGTVRRMVALVLILLMAVSILSTFLGCGLLSSSSGNNQKKVKCNYCGGRGRVDGEKCPWCGGSGYTYDNYFNDTLGY